MKRVDTIIYKGIKFRRYPQSDNYSDRNYYRPNGKHIKNGIEALHREVWKDEKGEIPEGYHIHHKDGDPTNNDINNLECLSIKEHGKRHRGREVSEEELERLAEIRKQAAEWHGSEEGKEWHKKHAKKVWEEKEEEKFICKFCGEEFYTKSINKPKYCSNKCKSAARRASGVDDEERECVICGSKFTVNKYRKTKTCSKECSGKLRSKNNKENKS